MPSEPRGASGMTTPVTLEQKLSLNRASGIQDTYVPLKRSSLWERDLGPPFLVAFVVVAVRESIPMANGVEV